MSSPSSAAPSTSAAADAAPVAESKAAVAYVPFNLGRYFLDKLTAQDGSRVEPAAAFAGKVAAFYFGAQWCPPCRKLTTRLADMYGELAKNPATPFEVRSAPVALKFASAFHSRAHPSCLSE
jgi:thiol-disulfide isomerase/thioredoxin